MRIEPDCNFAEIGAELSLFLSFYYRKMMV